MLVHTSSARTKSTRNDRSRTCCTPRLLIIDAANVVGDRPAGWWRDRPTAARLLVEQLRISTTGGQLDPAVIVGLEGVARSGIPEAEAEGVRVMHAAGSGDDLLVQLAKAAAPGPVVLVSADRELRRRLGAVGGSAVGADWLRRRMGHGRPT